MRPNEVTSALGVKSDELRVFSFTVRPELVEG
jgi:hypothetical protein